MYESSMILQVQGIADTLYLTVKTSKYEIFNNRN